MVAVSRRLTGGRATSPTGGRKTVTYWVMRHVGGEFVADRRGRRRPLGQPDRRRRDCSPTTSSATSSTSFAALPVPDSVVVLVRHAKAGKRGGLAGRRRRAAAGRHRRSRRPSGSRCSSAYFAPDRIVSADAGALRADGHPGRRATSASRSPSTRCSPTTTTSARRTPPRPRCWRWRDPGRSRSSSSQGATIPGLVTPSRRGSRTRPTKKGAAWVLVGRRRRDRRGGQLSPRRPSVVELARPTEPKAGIQLRSSDHPHAGR